MKSLVLSLALSLALSLVAVSMADDAVDLQQCFNEAKAFKICSFRSVNETIHKNLGQLKGLKEALETCFNQDGVKGVCAMPSLPAHAAAPPPAFTPPAEAVACFDGAKAELMKCVKEQVGIPADFKPQGADEHQQQMGRRPGFGMPPFPHDPKEIEAKINEICKNNADAVKALKTCALTAVKPFIPALMALNPMAAACQAGPACFKSNPISEACRGKLEQGAKAFCACRKNGADFMKNSPTCSAARDAFAKKPENSAFAAAHVEAAADAHHDLPPHPSMPVDFCTIVDGGKKPEDLCKSMMAGHFTTPKPQ